MKITIELTRAADLPEETWVSHCLEIDCVSQGISPGDAICALSEAVDMMVSDEISSKQNLDWESAFANIAAEVSVRNRSECLPPNIAELQEECRRIGTGELSASDAIQDAAPALIEIVAAALAYRDARRRAAKTRHELMRMAFPDSLSADSEARDKEEIRCREAFDLALAKVRP